MWKTYLIYGCHTTPISKHSTHEAVGRGNEGPTKEAGVRRLRERRAAAKAAVEIGDTSEELVSVNKTTQI